MNQTYSVNVCVINYIVRFCAVVIVFFVLYLVGTLPLSVVSWLSHHGSSHHRDRVVILGMERFSLPEDLGGLGLEVTALRLNRRSLIGNDSDFFVMKIPISD